MMVVALSCRGAVEVLVQDGWKPNTDNPVSKYNLSLSVTFQQDNDSKPSQSPDPNLIGNLS